VVDFRFGQSDKGLSVGDAQRQKQYSVEGRISGFVWSPDGRLIACTRMSQSKEIGRLKF
jgi:hypothetical protein